jgi:hypothetical protein
METPSFDDGAQRTDSAVAPDETWRTLRWIRIATRAAASRRSDAFAFSQVMT